MKIKKYQKIQLKNYNAAYEIAKYLKRNKCMSQLTFETVYLNTTGNRRHGELNSLMKTTRQFLFDHGVMDRQIINGLIIFIATKKCVHTKMENMFIEYQYVSDKDIDRAIDYQNINGGKLNFKEEGEIIGANIFLLKGEQLKYFTHNYELHMNYVSETDYVDNKFGILGVIRDAKFLKKTY